MKKFNIVLVVVMVLILTGCKEEVVDDMKTYEVNNIQNEICSVNTPEYTDDLIPIISFENESSDTFGDIDLFIDPCKEESNNPVVFANPKIKSYKFVVGFDAIYPLKSIELTNFIDDLEMRVQSIDLSISIDGYSFDQVLDDYPLVIDGELLTSIQLDNQIAKYVKISFSSEVGTGNLGSDFFGLNDIRFNLGSGYITKEATEWTDAFTRLNGWTGADGIFSFNLSNQDDSINAPLSDTLFIFSDTILGEVNPKNNVRYSPKIINNTIGYYDPNVTNLYDALTFETGPDNETLFLPDYFIGYNPSNLINQIGLTRFNDVTALYDPSIDGSSWLSSENDQVRNIIFDFYDEVSIDKLYLYNFVENLEFATDSFTVLYSNDGETWIEHSTNTLSKSEVAGITSTHLINDEGYLNLDLDARYIKLELTNQSTQIGLSKVLFTSNNTFLHAKVTASSMSDSIKENDNTSRLWLQDGIVIDNYFYTLPILVKDCETFFKVYKVGMIKVEIVNNQLDLNTIEYLDTPLQYTHQNGSQMYFGAGIMNQGSNSNMVIQDGYVYVYGYTDDEGRFLNVARVKEEDFENFNEWEYFDGSTFQEDINKTAKLIDGVSPELSVTYIEDGLYKGKYMLVVMENTTSGVIAYSISDTPYDFTEYHTVYNTTENRYLPGAFTYNAKMHPHLSEDGKYLISYNVNSSSLSLMSNPDLYRPRFIWLVETKER